MALFRKIFYRKPPEGLLEISERVYVFDFCFSKNLLEGNEYEAYIGHVVDQLHDYFPDASFIVFSFGDAAQHKQITNLLSEYNITLIDYPSHYENCPLLTVEMIHHFLRSSESWLCIGQKNVILMQCHKGAFPLLAFMLASFLIYRKQYTGEKRTLDMVYRQASQELLHSSSSLNPLPSQLRYLQYVSRRNIGSRWPPLDRALTLDCVILRAIPDMDGRGGCRPIFRVYGPDPLMAADRKPKLLFSMPKKSRGVGYFKQAESELVKIDINCHVQGDVVIECFTLDDNLEHEQIMFRVMFNTAFIRSNVLILNSEEIDTKWNVTDQFPKDFLAEVIFSDMDSSSSLVVPDFIGVEDIEGLPIEAFATIQEMFNNLDWGDPERENARNIIQQITVSSILEEKHELTSFSSARIEDSPQSGFFEARPTVVEGLKSEEVENESSSPSAVSKSSLDSEYTTKKIESSELHVSVQRPAQSKIISARIHQTSPPNHSSLSSSSQGSPIALSRYHSAPSAVGITALLHDSEFSDKEVSGALNPESSISPSAPSVLQPVQPTNSSVSQPEKQRKHHVDSKSGSGAPPPPPPPPMSLSTCLLIRKPQIRQQSPPSASPVPPPPPPPPPPLAQSTSVLSSTPSSPSPSPTPSLAHTLSGPLNAVPPAYPPPPPPPPLVTSESQSLSSVPSPPPPSPPSSNGSIVQNSSKVIHLSPTPSSGASPTIAQDSSKKSTVPASLPPPPPPQRADSATVSLSTCSVPPPPPPCPPGLAQKEAPDRIPQAVPPPPAPLLNASSKAGNAYSNLHSSASTLLGGKGKLQLRGNTRIQSQSKKTSLKPYHWLKLTRAMQGSLWAEAQKPEEAAKAPELDLSELESLFSANVPNSDHGGSSGKTNRGGSGLKSDKVHLIELRRAYNCEIMLTKVKIPLSDLMNLVLALDDSALDIDQVDNLIKFCPTKEEIELLKNYKGDKENLGKCEQFFLELMKVPRVESKLRVFSFKIQFCSQVSDLRTSLNVINSASDEVRNSVKLKRIMQTILSLGNALNHGTARGSAVGFRLDSLPKLAETRARNNKLTLIHYLCKVLASKLPEVLDFHEDLVSLEAATKIQLKYLAEEMQAISKGIEKVIQELAASENDGAVSENFCKTLKDFLGSAEAQVRSLASLYSGVGRNADALALYFGEDPARCPFEQVVSTLLSFVRMFKRAHEENCKQLEFEKKKKAQEEAEIAKAKPNSTSKKELAADSIMEAIFKKTNTDLGH